LGSGWSGSEGDCGARNGVAKKSDNDSRVQDFVFTSGKVKHKVDRMIIELGNIHAKWKLLIGNTCMLLVNGNETMWDGTLFGVCGRVTNKEEN
jgi:hypothetical protein